MKRRLLLGLAALAALAYASTYLVRAERFRPRLQRALEQALHRRVDLTGEVTYAIWNGPGFSFANVVIHEDPAVGIEPFAYVTQLDATLSPLALLRGRVEVSRVVLDEPTVNLAKQESGTWNVRPFLTRSPGGEEAQAFPTIRVRSGRLNLKFGDVKSVLYFANTDLDIGPGSGGRLDLRFRAEPARTDRPAQGIGTLIGRGVYRAHPGPKPSELELDLDLERSAVADIVTLLEGRSMGTRGFLASRARIHGPLDALTIDGSLRLEDIQRWDLLRAGSASGPIRYRGTLNLPAGSLDLTTAPEANPAPFKLRLRAQHLLDEPAWGSTLEFRELPVTALSDVLGYLNVALPTGVTLEGRLSGVLGYSRGGGLQGQIEMPEATLRGSDASFPLRDSHLTVEQSQFRLTNSRIELKPGSVAELEGTYGPGGYSLTFRSGPQFVPASAFVSAHGQLFRGDVPLLSRLTAGDWSGALTYSAQGEAAPAWSGQLVLRNAEVPLDGIAAPVLLGTASVALDAGKVLVESFAGSAGGIEFLGSLRPGASRLQFAELDLAALEKLFLPTLRRTGGFLRSLSLRTSPPPPWLRERSVDAAVTVKSLRAGDLWLGRIGGRLVWNGPNVDLNRMEWERDEATASGRIRLRLDRPVPGYRVTAALQGLPWKGGAIDGDAEIATSGLSLELVRNARASGKFTAKGLAFPPDGDFRSVSGTYEFAITRGLPVLKLTALEALQGTDTLTGQGATETDGRLLVDLASARRKLRIEGTLWPLQLDLTPPPVSPTER